MDRAEQIKSLVELLQFGFTTILALALTEGLIRFSAEVTDAKLIEWSRLPGLLTFLFFIFPFFQGMGREFYLKYIDKSPDLAVGYGLQMEIDSFVFIIEAALFFLMTRCFALERLHKLLVLVVLLSVLDLVWLVLSKLFFQSALKTDWIYLDILTIIAFGGMWLFRSRGKNAEWLARLAAFASLTRTIADLFSNQGLYFP